MEIRIRTLFKDEHYSTTKHSLVGIQVPIAWIRVGTDAVVITTAKDCRVEEDYEKKDTINLLPKE